MSEQTLTSLAILTVNWDRGHNLIESFVPIVAECIRKNDNKPVALVELQKAVREEAGIKIPSGALQAILSRCAREDLVQKKNKVYLPNRSKLDAMDYASTHSEAVRRYGSLLEKLRRFAKERYRMEWSKEEADEHLLAFLQDGSVPVLAAATEGDPLPGGRKQSRKAQHVLSAFVGHLAEADIDGFDCLEVVVKGFVLSSVLYYPDLGQVDTRLDKLAVYCDTPFLLKALGYSEEGLHVQALDLLDLLKELGAKLRCFHHTREELAGVLEAEAANLRAGANGGSAFGYSMSRTFRREDIEEMIVKIDSTLRHLGVEVVDTPAWTDRPDEAKLEEALDAGVYYPRDRAREKDMQSLAAVARLRNLHRMNSFESAKAVFVTTNMDLARASSKFFHDIEGPGSIPICLSVGTMTRLAWVKKPLSAPDLPKHMVMASSYAALNPSAKLWRAYLEAISRRREKGELSDEEYHLLRSSREARQALMDKTLGQEEAFSTGTLDEVLTHAKAAIRAEAETKTNKERQQREVAEADARRQRERLEGIEHAHRALVDRRARHLGRIAGFGLASLLLVAVIVGALASIPDFPLLDVKSLAVRIVIWICLALFVGLTLYAVLSKQLTVRDTQRWISTKAENWWADRGHQRLDDLHSGSQPVPADETPN